MALENRETRARICVLEGGVNLNLNVSGASDLGESFN